MLDPFCSDPFDNSTANPKDCSLEEELPHLRGVPANMCRKIRMKGTYFPYSFETQKEKLFPYSSLIFVSVYEKGGIS